MCIFLACASQCDQMLRGLWIEISIKCPEWVFFGKIAAVCTNLSTRRKIFTPTVSSACMLRWGKQIYKRLTKEMIAAGLPQQLRCGWVTKAKEEGW